ncbi:SLC13/DASS family transporter [Phycicoccus sp. CSK15P-2]|uniref:SLC13 family permease n=1 Tax=Phycicoccus sp. CSK15P-2 TaxID=2807627 RepID=UPI00194FAD83|nr:SLC13 family permease [Phycicoccus sp. CSK15P-2]MBM6405032.1 SLC13/DASS family transporter [Phycicoccus sp. CSK15P-2]
MSSAAPDRTRTDVTEEDPDPRRSPRSVWGMRLLGVVLSGIVYLLLGGAELSGDGRVVASVAVLMAVWWMSEAIPLSATALIPIVALPSLTAIDIDDATAPYADSIVFLFLGGFLIAIAMQKWNLHRRIALLTLRRVGTHPRRIVLGMMIATAFLSMWVSNTATTLMMLPIALSVLALVVENTAATSEEESAGIRERLEGDEAISDIVEHRGVRLFGVALLLSVAWSASIGGLGTLLGSPPNAIVAGYISSELDQEVGFAQWMMLGLPIVVVFVGLAWVLITRVLFRFDLDSIPGGDELIQRQIDDLGPMSRGEKIVLAVFSSAAFLWIVPGLLSNIDALDEAVPWLGSMEDTAIAIAAGLVMFFVPADRDGRMTLEWRDAEKGLPWGVLLLFGGGLSLAGAVKATGLDEWLGAQVTGLGALPVVLLLGAVVALVLMLTEVTSNTATAATFIPVLGGVAVGLDVDPMTLLIPAALAATCAFMLPVGTPPNAIVFGSGSVRISEMARGGAVLNVVGVLLITLFTVLLGPVALGLVL